MSKISLDTNVLIYNHGIDGDTKLLSRKTSHGEKREEKKEKRGDVQ